MVPAIATLIGRPTTVTVPVMATGGGSVNGSLRAIDIHLTAANSKGCHL
jgi:hypothetical protein